MRSRSSVPVYFPVTPNIFPVWGQKIPGYAATGIRPQAIDESAPFSRPNGRRGAESTRFPVIFPVHGNLRRRRSYPRGAGEMNRLDGKLANRIEDAKTERLLMDVSKGQP
jgi:hypothetical protein